MLRITWDHSSKPQMFIGLNPSTADESHDDPTIRRCIDFAMRWGRGGIVMANAFAFRSTNPEPMIAMGLEAVGEENNIKYLERLASECAARPIACWGTKAKRVRWGFKGNLNREHELKIMMGPLDCLRITKEGCPEHPLYLPAKLMPIPYNYIENAEVLR